jgi:hypothetical protein
MPDETVTVAVEADTAGFDKAIGDLSLKANAFGAALTGALRGAATGGKSLDGVLRQLAMRLSSIALCRMRSAGWSARSLAGSAASLAAAGRVRR